MKRADRKLATDLLLGAIAGAAATWVMDLATTLMYEREPKEAQDRENAARGNKNAYETAAEKAASLAGRTLDEDERKLAGNAIHWTLGVSSGVMYGALRNRLPLGLGSGLAYGTLFWLAMDEAALTLAGLTPPPKEFPWQTHARGLAGHLILGAGIESFFDLADGLTRGRE
ncbi:MAG: putative periplasmic/secreted protein [Acidobacteria bacterium]|nr:putative periplasmic/secreted protein [Acidobacteriota bacterium]